jgi:hypothetical protein
MTKQQIQATLTLPDGKSVKNGLTCVGSAPLSPPGSGGTGGGGFGGNSGTGGSIGGFGGNSGAGGSIISY